MLGVDTVYTCTRFPSTNIFKIKNLKAGDKSVFVDLGEVLNPPNTGPIGDLKIQGFDENNFLMDEGTFVNFNNASLITPSEMEGVTISRSEEVISKAVVLTVNFTLFNLLPGGSKIQIFISN